MVKFKIWLMVVAIYLAMFGTPIAAGYILFAEQIEAKTGGGFFYIIGSVTFVLLLRKILAAIKKQKAGITKAMFKFAVSFVTLYILYEFVGYINGNFSDLRWVLLWTLGGRIVALAFELWAVKIDKVFLEEIGVV